MPDKKLCKAKRKQLIVLVEEKKLAKLKTIAIAEDRTLKSIISDMIDDYLSRFNTEKLVSKIF